MCRLFDDELHAFNGEDGDGFADFNDLAVGGAGRPFGAFDFHSAAEIVDGRKHLAAKTSNSVHRRGRFLFAGEDRKNDGNTA